MQYVFPIITHIDQVLDVIKERPEFIIRHDQENGFKAIKYVVNFEDTFPKITGEESKILRECRGIKFDDITKKVICRPFHKFFNIGEKDEVKSTNIDLLNDYCILEKLDGSMLCPILINGKIRWTTKLGITKVSFPVEEFYRNHKEYHDFVECQIKEGYTPIFEWTSPQQRIVLNYEEDDLVLMAVRHNESGQYKSLDVLGELSASYGIPVIKESFKLKNNNLDDFIEETRKLVNKEGYIIRFTSGHMIKLKGDWYCNIHKLLVHVKLEKDVLRLILKNEIDDIRSFLSKDILTAIDSFTNDMIKNIDSLSEKIYWEAQTAYDNLNGSKKRFAVDIIRSTAWHEKHARFLFISFENLEGGISFVKETIMNVILNSISNQSAVDKARFLFGNIRWESYVTK